MVVHITVQAIYRLRIHSLLLLVIFPRIFLEVYFVVVHIVILPEVIVNLPVILTPESNVKEASV